MSSLAPPSAVVSYATRDRAYFDAGEDSGLRVGAPIRFFRGGRALPGCNLDRVSRSHASCAVHGSRIGDRVELEGIVAPRETVVSSTVGPSRAELSTEEAAEIRDAIGHAPFLLLDAKATAATRRNRALGASVSLNHDSFAVLGTPLSHFERESLSFRMHDLQLGFWGLAASVDLTAVAWSRRTDRARYRLGSTFNLFVFESAVYAREAGSPVIAGVGRIQPWYTPGLVYVDGLQLGWRPVGSQLELGIVAGAIPDLITLEPQSDRWLVNGYWSAATGDEDFVASEGRVGVGYSKQLSTIGELESRLYLRHGRSFRGSLGGRGVLDAGGVSLAGGQAAVSFTPLDDLDLSATAEARSDRFELQAPSYAVVGADHVSASARYRGLPFMTVALNGGWAKLRADDELRAFVGPEIGFPQFFGDAGDLAVGYEEALGFVPGRTVWAQILAHPVAPLDGMFRLSYREDRVEGGALQELGLFAHLDWRIVGQLRARATLLASLPVFDVGQLLPNLGTYARISLVGEL